jgi:ABC-type Na+ efflux pump permease subunit
MNPISRNHHLMSKLLIALIFAATALAGCGVVAAPCRIASAGLKMVPVVGHVAAAPTDVCADVIDP